jgi:HEAT repeat protein
LVVRLNAGIVLGGMGSEAREAVPALVQLLQAGEVPDRKLAALTLGYLGPAAAEAVPALLLAARDADEGVPSGTLSLDGLGLAPEQVGVRAGAVSGAAAALTA